MTEKVTDINTEINESVDTQSTETQPVTVKPKRQRKSPAKTKVESPPIDSAKITQSPTPKNESKPLSVSQWLEEAKNINEYTKYYIDKEKNTYVNYNEVFSEVKIEQLITELYEHMVFDHENEIGFFINYEAEMVYMNFLIIKYFTDMKDLMSDSLVDNIAVINVLREDSKFKRFFEEIFDNEQVIRVYEVRNNWIEMLAKVENMKEEQFAELMETVQTPFLKERLIANKNISSPLS